MAIKFLRGIYKAEQLKTTRPEGFKFPLGLSVSNDMDQANSSTTATTGTFDVLLVAGGGSGGNSYLPSTYHTGGGGAGGVRLLTGNSLSEIAEFKSPSFITGTTNFIPVIVGGGGGNSCVGPNFVVCRGGAGAPVGPGGFPGGSGGGGGKRGQGSVSGAGTGIAGQGCNGTEGGPGGNGGAGGSATCTCTAPALCNCNGLNTSITGTPVRFGDGGNGAPTPANATPGTANRGNGGNGGAPGANPPNRDGGAGGSGIVAIRYRNSAAPTTPLASGGDTICCTGGCIIHVFCSSGFFNVNTDFSIN